jgi:tetratricopeptide (TPR) repeat protein
MKSGLKPYLLIIISGILVLGVIALTAFSYSTATIFNEAELAYFSEEYETSIDLFTKIQNRYPICIPNRSEEVAYYLEGANMLNSAEEFEASNKYEEAISVYRDFLIAHPDEYFDFNINTNEFLAYKKWADLLYETQAYEEMMEVYSTMESKYSDNSYFDNLNFIEKRYPDIYYQWGKLLWENEEYKDANKKFHKVLSSYENSPYAKDADLAIQGLYLDWATSFAEAEDYENAFNYLDDIQEKWPLSKTSDLSNELYLEIGFKYANELHKDSNFKEEVEIIENLISKYPFSKQINELQAAQQMAYLAYANQSLEKNKYYDAISIYELAKKHTEDEETIAEIDEKISVAHNAILFDKEDEGKRLITEVTTAICYSGAELPEIVNLIPDDASKVAVCGSSTYKIDSEFIANSLGEIKYIIEIKDKTKTVENCSYEGNHYLLRLQKLYEITIYNAKTGKRITSHSIHALLPEECPDYYTFKGEKFSILDVTENLYGPDVDKEKVDEWLSKYLPKP